VGVSLLDRLRAWWNRDAVETAEEEAGITQAERDVAEEDYEGRKDDVATHSDYPYAAGTADYERDSEPPDR
jgi:hypothetical protein